MPFAAACNTMENELNSRSRVVKHASAYAGARGYRMFAYLSLQSRAFG